MWEILLRAGIMRIVGMFKHSTLLMARAGDVVEVSLIFRPCKQKPDTIRELTCIHRYVKALGKTLFNAKLNAFLLSSEQNVFHKLSS
jgi:hypothetical protein